MPASRNILKTNDVRTGLKKPEQDSNKRAASSEPAKLAEAAQAADVARPDPAQAADQSGSDRQTHDTSEAAAAAARDDGGAHAAPSKWDIAKSVRERCGTSAAYPTDTGWNTKNTWMLVHLQLLP